MRTFFRRYYTHNRYVSALSQPLDALKLDTDDTQMDTSELYVDIRPYLNRCVY